MATHPTTSTVAREVRFAVVMYGGVSLAIYINGIAQELLHLVRATASAPAPAGADDNPAGTGHREERAVLGDAHLRGTERVYRRIGQMLDGGGSWDPSRVVRRDADGRWVPTPLAADGPAGAVRPDEPIRTRFVIDVLSGTSAGGINAVFLAKALATGKSMDALARLWVNEGDIARLLNDREAGSKDYDTRTSPTSLLNSRHMYRKLHDALQGMDYPDEPSRQRESGIPRTPSLVPTVDLYVTTTDIRGLPIALRLADGVVAERRHRNVFHFRFARDRRDRVTCNDFIEALNPMLAFAARCTSSFPFAFEPMTMGDVDRVLPPMGSGRGGAAIDDERHPWRRFFPAYVGMRDQDGAGDVAAGIASSSATPWLLGGAGALALRAFGDGGYLDNKPFGYAIDALSGRRAPVQVDRKLIYLEPSPEHPEFDRPSEERPNAFENVMAALSLARYETIRGDLQRVLERNRLVERVDRIVRGVDEDLMAAERGVTAQKVAYDSSDYAQNDLVDMIDRFGSAYGGYHRLRVSALTDEIADYVSRAIGYDETSDEFAAVRHLVSAWRGKFYAPYFRERGLGSGGAERHAADSAPGTRTRTESAFLQHYDLNYRIRRLDFVIDRLQRLLCLDDGAQAMLERSGLSSASAMFQRARGPAATATELEFLGRFENKLRDLRQPLAEQLEQLRDRRQALLSRDRRVNPITELPPRASPAPKGEFPLILTRAQMLRLLEPPTTDARTATARQYFEAHEPVAHALTDLERRIADAIGAATTQASVSCRALLPVPSRADLSEDEGDAVALHLLGHYYHAYSRYDQLIFPAFFSTDVGEEADVVDVVRLSPDDATSLIDERAATERRKKLAGVTLGHFGAFVERSWRWNDIMWGRLDSAERLITTLLPGGSEAHRQARAALIREAHGAILEEEFAKDEAGTATRAQEQVCDARQRLRALAAGRPEDDPERVRLRAALASAISEAYEIDRRPTPEPAVRTAARATRIVGRMFDGLSAEYAMLGTPAIWLSRLGSIGWGLVEAAAPQSPWSIVASWWVKLLYLFAAVLILIGLFSTPVLKLGIVIGSLTLLTHLTVLSLGDLFARQTLWWRRIAIAAVLALAVVLTLGGLVLLDPSLRVTVLAAIRHATTLDAVLRVMQAVLIGVLLCVLLVAALYFQFRQGLDVRASREARAMTEALLETYQRATGAAAGSANRRSRWRGVRDGWHMWRWLRRVQMATASYGAAVPTDQSDAPHAPDRQRSRPNAAPPDRRPNVWRRLQRRLWPWARHGDEPPREDERGAA